MVCLGEAPMNEAAQEAVRRGREERYQKLLEQQFDHDMGRSSSKLSRETVCIPNQPSLSLSPGWDEYSNSMFEMRLQVIERFVCAGSTVLLRTRARRRLKALLAAMQTAGVTSRKACAQWVDAESKATRTVGANQGTEVPVVHIPLKGFVVPLSFPTTRLSTGEAPRELVEVDLVDSFFSVDERNLKERLDFEVLGYTQKDALFRTREAAYMRPSSAAGGQRWGCMEERSIRGPRGDWKDGAEAPLEMPASCLLTSAHEPISLIIPSVECRAYLRPPYYTECNTEYRLKEVPPLREPALDPLNLPSISASPWKWLHIWRRTRTLHDPAAHFEPCLGNTLLGGGGGPRLGHDLGGERLPFLRSEGFDYDLPSDTDSDGRDDSFALEPPTRETYMKDYSAQDDHPVPTSRGAIVSEMHSKIAWLDQSMHDAHALNNCAMRKRAEELNDHLPRHLTCYLG